MKSYIPTMVIIASLLVASCSKKESLLLVKFSNESGVELKELIIGEEEVGTLLIDESTEYLPFDALHFDTGFPDENASAVVDGEEIFCTSQFYWCGTEKTCVTEGTYEIVIRISEFDGVKYLTLDNI